MPMHITRREALAGLAAATQITFGEAGPRADAAGRD